MDFRRIHFYQILYPNLQNSISSIYTAWQGSNNKPKQHKPTKHNDKLEKKMFSVKSQF